MLVLAAAAFLSLGAAAEGAECTEPWVEPKPSHLFGRCGIDEVSQDEMAAGKFAQHYSLQRPFIVRNASFNDAARQFLADRCKIMRQYGDVSVDVGDPFSLTIHGRASSSTTLREYLDTPFDPAAPRYFFDRMGHW